MSDLVRNPEDRFSHKEANLRLIFSRFAFLSASFGGITPLRDCLRTHKDFTKDQCFYLNYHKFSIKSYVLDVY